MQKIGQGWQFNVYDRGATVEKVPTTRPQVRWKLARTYPALLLKPTAFAQKVDRIIAERDAVMGELMRRNADADLFANLHIVGDRIFQDKVTPLGEALHAATEAEGRRLIDAYVAANLEGWRRGMAETSFNFTVNHGVDAFGQIVLIDVGELTFRKDVIAHDIETRLWERAWSVVHDLPETLCAYFLTQMDKYLTLSNLKRYWRATTMRRSHPIHRPDRAPVPHHPSVVRPARRRRRLELVVTE